MTNASLFATGIFGEVYDTRDVAPGKENVKWYHSPDYANFYIQSYIALVRFRCQACTSRDSLIKTFLVAVKTVDTTFNLRRRRTNLESQLVVIQLLLGFLDTLQARILKTVLDALH